MTSRLRAAVHDDLAVVREIVRAAYSPHIARIGREPGPMLDDYGALIEAGRVHVAERDGAVRGVLVLVRRPRAMLLQNVAVAPEAQGSGLGRLMLEFAENAAIEAGYRAIELYTNEAMTENVALYSRIGYVETHRIVERGLRRIYMRKPLGEPDPGAPPFAGA